MAAGGDWRMEEQVTIGGQLQTKRKARMSSTTYRAADGHAAGLADLIADLGRLSSDLEAAAAAGVTPDPQAARALARVIEHHRGQMASAIDVRAVD
jgi:hypothetical protein